MYIYICIYIISEHIIMHVCIRYIMNYAMIQYIIM